MMLGLFLAFVALALYCEVSLWRRMRRWAVRRWLLYLYEAITVLLWVVTLACIAGFMAGWDTGSGFTKVCGVVLIAFFLNGMAKMFYVLLGYVGRRTGWERTMSVVSWGAVVFIAATIVYGASAGRSRIRVEEEMYLSDRVPEAFDGFRIVLFSDIHTGLLLNRDGMLRRLVNTVNSLDADIVVNGGDIVNYDYRELDSTVMNILSGIRSRYGVYSVLGNHDLGIYIRDKAANDPADNIRKIELAQSSIGWHILRDTSVMILKGSDTLWITGLNYPDELVHRSHRPASDTLDVSHAYMGVPDAGFNITLSHAPQVWDAIRMAGRGDVTLSGHVHSLQMKLSLGGWRWSPAAWLYDRWSGAYRDGENLLYINDGIGYAMIPMRIGAMPEVTLITLKRDGSDSIGGGFE